jgi:ribosomal protein L23
MMKHHEIIIEPLITEKSTLLKEQQKVYCFLVRREASKVDF